MREKDERIKMIFACENSTKPATARGFSSRLAAGLLLLVLLASALAACTVVTRVQDSLKKDESRKSSEQPIDSSVFLNDAISFKPIDRRAASLLDAGLPRVLEQQSYTLGRCFVSYPVFVGANSARLNSELRSALRSYAEHASSEYNRATHIRCELAFTGRGLFSFWFIIEPIVQYQLPSEDIPELDRTTFNFDLLSGSTLDLSACFGGELSTATLGRLGELVDQHARAQGYTPITLVGPMEKNRRFVFGSFDAAPNDELRYGLVFYYGLYEYALPSQGCPQIFIDADELAFYASEPLCPVARLAE